MTRTHFTPVILFSVIVVQGCANPRFNVPYEAGYPNATSINRRILCELADMVRPGQSYGHRELLLQGNYRIAAVLSLGVNLTAGAKPTVNTTSAISGGTLKFDVGGNLSQSTERNSSTYLEYSIGDISDRVKEKEDAYECPPAVTHLAGDLGIKDLVSTSAPLPIDQGATGQGGQFGGTITFTTTAGVTSFGPTWVLKRISGPGAFASLSNVYTDKLTLAFFQQPLKPTPADTEYARREAQRILRDIVDQDTLQQLNSINNKL